MVRQRIIRSRGRHSPASDAELSRLAAKFVELMLNPDYPWLSHYFLMGGFTYQVESARTLALDIAHATAHDFFVPKEFADAVFGRNRDKLVPLVKDRLRQAKLSPEYFTQVLQALNPSLLRKAIQEAESIFKLRRGPKPKLPRHKYPELRVLADQLRPVIEKLITELDSGTKRPISDFLEFWRKEHPEACSLLLRHLGRLEQALIDPALRKRGTKIKSRARVLADALAGSDYGLTFLTSRDRASAIRRSQSTNC
jgi:hypothetical protein